MKNPVIVRASNRSQTLPAALKSCAASQLAPRIEWEVRVADGNPNDLKREVAVEYSRRYPGNSRECFHAELELVAKLGTRV